MVELTHFVRSFSDNDRLINAASRIPCVIKRVMMDVRAKRMALILSCPQTIPDGKDLIALEADLMDATGISGVRIHLEGEAFQDISEAVAGPLRDWILTCVTRNDPMLLSLVEDAGFCAKGGKVIVSFAIPSDPVLVTELSRKIERFSEQHLPARCNIEIVSIAKSTGRVAIEQVRKIEDQWRCEARKIMSRQSKEPESTEPELSQKSNLTKKLTPPFGTGHAAVSPPCGGSRYLRGPVPRAHARGQSVSPAARDTCRQKNARRQMERPVTNRRAIG